VIKSRWKSDDRMQRQFVREVGSVVPGVVIVLGIGEAADGLCKPMLGGSVPPVANANPP
jgi:hypothetical protein